MKFRVTQNLIRNVECVEVYDDAGQLLATVNAHQRGLHVVSKHLMGTETPPAIVPVPSVLVLLDTETKH